MRIPKNRFLRQALFVGLLCFPLAVAGAAQAQAQDKSADPALVVVRAGVQAYLAKGPDEAMRAWIKGSPMDGSKEALSQANNLRQVQDYYGAFQSFDLIASKTITGRVRNLYVVLNYEKGPLYADFAMFRSEQGWMLTSLNFNTKAANVLPASLLP